MTDRYYALTVHLDADYRSDDSEQIINAIRMIKGVARVEPLIADGDIEFARIRVKQELREQLWDVLKP